LAVIVVDTGLYLACSALNRRQAERSIWLSVLHGLSVRLQATLTTSNAVVMEAAQHTSSFLRQTSGSWDHDRAIAFFGRFFAVVTPYQLAPPSVLDAVENLRRSREAMVATPKRRSSPTLADAVTAQVVREADAAVLISDDGKDFRKLLAGHDFEQLPVAEALRLVRPH